MPDAVRILAELLLSDQHTRGCGPGCACREVIADVPGLREELEVRCQLACDGH